MIIFGTQKNKLDTIEVPGIKCQHCNSTKTVLFRLYQQYGHFFWIPMFPIDKIAVTVCTHCKQALTDSEIPKSYWDVISTLTYNKKTPKWTFVGLALVALFMVMMIIVGLSGGSETRSLIKEPKVGDVYHFVTKDLHYTVKKVDRITNDSVYFHESLFESITSFGLNDLSSRGDTIYNKAYTIGYSKDQLLKWHSVARILEVERNK